LTGDFFIESGVRAGVWTNIVCRIITLCITVGRLYYDKVALGLILGIQNLQSRCGVPPVLPRSGEES